LRAAAEEIGFSYLAEDPRLRLSCSAPGASTVRVQNVLRGQAQGLEVVVFDLLQQIRRAQYIRHVRFSLLLFRDDEANWPPSPCDHAGSCRAWGNRSGTGTSLLEDDQAFARRYHLEALRRVCS